MRTYNIPIKSSYVMNASFNGTPLQLKEMFGYSIQAVYTGTPTGTFKLQVSSDPLQEGVPNPPAPSTWTDLANSSAAVAAAGNYMWNVNEVNYNWVRLVYTDGSSGASTAVLNAKFNGKGI